MKVHAEEVQLSPMEVLGVEPLEVTSNSLIQKSANPNHLLLLFIDKIKEEKKEEKQLTACTIDLNDARKLVMHLLDELAKTNDMLAIKLKKEIQKDNAYELN